MKEKSTSLESLLSRSEETNTQRDKLLDELEKNYKLLQTALDQTKQELTDEIKKEKYEAKRAKDATEALSDKQKKLSLSKSKLKELEIRLQELENPKKQRSSMVDYS